MTHRKQQFFAKDRIPAPLEPDDQGNEISAFEEHVPPACAGRPWCKAGAAPGRIRNGCSGATGAIKRTIPSASVTAGADPPGRNLLKEAIPQADIRLRVVPPVLRPWLSLHWRRSSSEADLNRRCPELQS